MRRLILVSVIALSSAAPAAAEPGLRAQRQHSRVVLARVSSMNAQLEHLYREVRAFRIYDGPSETHRWAIARRVLRVCSGFGSGIIERQRGELLP